MEGLAERQRGRAVAEPACLDDARLEGGAVQRQTKPCLARRCMHDQFLLGRRRVRAARSRSRTAAQSASRVGSMSTTVTRAAGMRASSDARQQADHAGADDQHALAGERRRIPNHVQRRLHVGSQHRTPRRHRVGHRDAHLRRREEDVLVRMQHEDPPAIRNAARRRCSRISPETATARAISGARIAWCWLSGTRPANTSASVPRETPLASVRTST